LLIVIGILAILSTTIVLVINPAELLRKARDSQRISDLNTVKTAIAYYVTEAGSPGIGNDSNSYSHVASTNCAGRTGATGNLTPTDSGWIPIPFDDLTGGSPIGALPKDPSESNSATDTPARYYVYLTNTANTTFLLVANMESDYYSSGGEGDVESTDGGQIYSLYEVGTDLTLLPATSSSCFPG
jgi:type II secretory pathway pseudopilin PulG